MMNKYIIKQRRSGVVKLPDEVVEQFGEGGLLYVIIDPNPCLRLLTKQEFENLLDKIRNYPEIEKLRPFLAYAFSCLIHKGRIDIPEKLMSRIDAQNREDLMLVINDGVCRLYERKTAEALFEDII